MISVEEATRRILAAVSPLPGERVMLSDAFGRVLAEDVISRRTQPPHDVSAMDGYAVRAADVAEVPCTLKIVGRIQAGGLPDRAVGPGEAVRLFTGAPMPPGADAVVIQEDADAEGTNLRVRESVQSARHVRKAGLDFRAGAVGLKAGRVLTSRDIGLAAAMNVPWLSVRQRPRIALLATGDEIALPGDPVGPGQIVSSSGPALAAFVQSCGGIPVNLGVAGDTIEALSSLASAGRDADVLVTMGGASVGEHDLVQEAFLAEGMELDFWKIAMRPGKPLMFGRLGKTLVLGLPGNPVSSLVCALLFLRPAIAGLLGIAAPDTLRAKARLGVALPPNGEREDYMRAELRRNEGHLPQAMPFSVQDSSMLSSLCRSDCLIVRRPHAPAAKEGEVVDVMLFGGGSLPI